MTDSPSGYGRLSPGAARALGSFYGPSKTDRPAQAAAPTDREPEGGRVSTKDLGMSPKSARDLAANVSVVHEIDDPQVTITNTSRLDAERITLKFAGHPPVTVPLMRLGISRGESGGARLATHQFETDEGIRLESWKMELDFNGKGPVHTVEFDGTNTLVNGQQLQAQELGTGISQ